LNSVDRRAAFGQIAVGAAVVAGLPQFAVADGAVSAATISRAKFTHGSKIAALKSAVEKGDLEAVAAEKNSFILFNSGAYPTAKDKALKKAAIADTNAIFSAVRSGDKSALKSAYSKYVSANKIKPAPAVSAKNGQGYSGDFDYKVRTSAGYVFERRGLHLLLIFV
jgi:Photosystem II Psb31 protein